MDSWMPSFIFSFLIIMSVYIDAAPSRKHRATPFWEKKALDDHVITEKNKTDSKSVPFRRNLLLYSRASMKHIRIIGPTVDGSGMEDDEYAKLVFESVTFGRVTIRSLKTGRYLCMNNRGKLIGRKKKAGQRERKKKCMFKEIVSKGYRLYESVKYRDWFVAINRKGHVVQGPLSTRGKRSRQFMQRHYRNNGRSRSISGRSPRKRRIKKLRMRLRMHMGRKDKTKKRIMLS